MEKIPWWYTEIGEAEKANVLAAFNGKHFSLGPVTSELESKIAQTLGAKYVVVVPSGTSALTAALMAAGVGPGDEVIVPDLTWIATANAAAILGAKVVLVDCQKDLPLMDPDAVRKKISSRTKVIIPVHLNGRSCDLEQLRNIADQSGALLIEDACKAFASNTPRGYLGTVGDLGCFSLGMIAPVSAGYGGAVATGNPEYYEKLLRIRNQGVPLKGEEQYSLLGFNFKYSDILASIGLAQLARLDEKLKHIRTIYDHYKSAISINPYVQLIPVNVAVGEIPLCAEVRSKYREEIISYLARQGVETLRFHRPLHEAAYLGVTGDFPCATSFAQEGFILPCGPSQPLENVRRCIELLQEWRPLL